MNGKLTIIPTFLLMINIIVHGQSRGLKVGDRLDFRFFDNAANSYEFLYPSAKKPALTIIDFWNINCAGCIAAMPDMEELQQQNDRDIQIVLVTTNSAASVDSFFSKRKFKKPALPMIVGDSLLSKFFPYESVPHHVWMDQEGVVKFITSGKYSNQETITAFLKKIPMELPLKNDFWQIDVTKPLWHKNNGDLSESISYYSLISAFSPRFTSYLFRIKRARGRIEGFKLFNVPLLMLYKKAYGGITSTKDFAADGRIFLETKDSSRFKEPDALHKKAWMKSNFYSYECRIPHSDEEELCRIMREDLQRFFPYRVSIEKRQVSALTLVRIDPTRLESKEPKAGIQDDYSIMHFQNSKFSNLVWFLKPIAEKSGKPFLDLTCFSGLVTLSLPYSVYDWKAASGYLEVIGFKIIEQVVELDAMVISDNVDR